jgi:hypothetical protein
VSPSLVATQDKILCNPSRSRNPFPRSSISYSLVRILTDLSYLMFNYLKEFKSYMFLQTIYEPYFMLRSHNRGTVLIFSVRTRVFPVLQVEQPTSLAPIQPYTNPQVKGAPSMRVNPPRAWSWPLIIIIIYLSCSGPVVDPFLSHVSRSLLKVLPWFLLPVREQCFITLGNLLRGILFTRCIHFLLYSSNLSKIGVIFNPFAICFVICQSVLKTRRVSK